MPQESIVKKNITLNANLSSVWKALTDPSMTKQYMFGCELISDWKEGSEIIWKDEETIRVTGHILSIDPEKTLQFTVFDPHMGLEDIPSNYLTVTYQLSSENNITTLSVSQGDFSKVENSEKRYHDTLAGWEYALNGLKALLEN
ncbi:SRPBCC domain-containing protein [Fulvivirgaceae bacterium BMA10]|uniref:SRPBCC domain-containing protein n=1 Tax=Splendidivirga corallicola TaxID=3051826 RepID=A0ABT8KXL0_9BACT|nr:SRPBCC domain-containing protein [Fulvivirgaceae bacterium BMA10]